MEPTFKLGIAAIPQDPFPPFGKQTYFFSDMLAAVPEQASRVFFFSPLDYRGETEINGWVHENGNWVRKTAPIPPLIYDRTPPAVPEHPEALRQFREQLTNSAHQFLNPPPLAKLLNDKVSFHAFLEERGIPTLPAWDREAVAAGAWEGETVFLKPIGGAQGKDIYRLEEQKQGFLVQASDGDQYRLSHGETLEMLNGHLNEQFFLQPEAKVKPFQGRTWDLRILVQNFTEADYRITGYGVRLGPEGRITANLGQGGSALPLDDLSEFLHDAYGLPQWELQGQIYDLCISVARALHASYGSFCEVGLDLLLDEEKGLLILEGNARPSRWIFTSIADVVEARGAYPDYWRKVRLKTSGQPLKWALGWK